MSENHKCCVKHNQIDIPLHLSWRLSENFSCKITFYLENEIKCKYQKKNKMKMIKRYDIKSVQVFEMSKKENDGLLSW